MKTKQAKLWVTVGRVRFTCDTIEEAAMRVKLFFQSWYKSGLCKESDQSDWHIWSNRLNKTGGRKHIANVHFGEIEQSK